MTQLGMGKISKENWRLFLRVMPNAPTAPVRRSQRRIEGTTMLYVSLPICLTSWRSQRRIEGIHPSARGLGHVAPTPEDLKGELKAQLSPTAQLLLNLPKISKENWRRSLSTPWSCPWPPCFWKISKENWRPLVLMNHSAYALWTRWGSQRRIEGIVTLYGFHPFLRFGRISKENWRAQSLDTTATRLPASQRRSQKRIEGSRCMLRRLWSRPREDLKGELKVMSLMYREF